MAKVEALVTACELVRGVRRIEKTQTFQTNLREVRKRSLSTVNEVASAELEDIELHPGRPGISCLKSCLHSTEGQFHLDVLSDFHRGTQRRQVLDVASNLQVSTSDPIATQQHV